MARQTRFDCASDQALLVSFGNEITREANGRVSALLASLQQEPVAGQLNLQPACCSLLIKFDLRRTTHRDVEPMVRERIARAGQGPAASGRLVEIPVCYGGELGPDLAELARLRQVGVEDLIRMHSQATYTAYFLGFVPGFAYLGTVSDRIAAPRLATPRKCVEAGSVGIAGRQTGVYPCPVPGGWRIIGRTPLAMFRADREPISLLVAGDGVRFRPVSPEQYARIGRGGA